MTRQLQEYLQRAREAGERAELTRDAYLKKQWRELANGYRNLAQIRLNLDTNLTTLGRPSPSPESPTEPQT